MANTGRGIKSSHASAKRITRGSRAATGGIETWTRNVHLASRHSLALFPLSILIREFYLTRNPIRVTFNVRTIFSNYERHAIARVCIPSRRLNPYVGDLLRSFWHKTTPNFHFLDIFAIYSSKTRLCGKIISIKTLNIFIKLSGDENIYREK